MSSCHDLAGAEMVKLSVRILMFLAVIAAGRAVIAGFAQADQPNEVIVVVLPGGGCPSNGSPDSDATEG